MAGLTTTAVADIAKLHYESGHLYKHFTRASDGLFNEILGRAESFEMGGKATQFMLDLGDPASGGNIGEKGKFIGQDSDREETVSTTVYAECKTIVRPYFYNLERSKFLALMDNGSRYASKNMKAFQRDVEGISAFCGSQHAAIFMLGGKDGFLWQLASSSPVSYSNGVITVSINTDPGSRRYHYSGRIANRNWPVEIVNASTGALVEADAHGQIIYYDGSTIKIACDKASPTINAGSYSDAHAIRWVRRKGSQALASQEFYGLADMLGTDAFPNDTGNGETSIDPAEVPEWAAVVNQSSQAGEAVLDDVDDLLNDLYLLSGFDAEMLRGECAIVTTLHVAQQLVRKMKLQMEYMPKVDQDERDRGYKYLINGCPVRTSRMAPKGVLQVFPWKDIGLFHLGMNQKNPTAGPMFVAQGYQMGGVQGLLGIASSTNPVDYMQMMCAVATMALRRNRFGVIEDME